MTKNFLILFVFFLKFSVYAQVGLTWAKSTEANGGGQFIKADESGNVYTTGRFTGTADFDPSAGSYNLISAGSIDVFISKLDVAGNFVWAKNMGGTSADAGMALAIDPSGNIYITGGFTDTADFDPGPGIFNLISNGDYNVFISKLDANGNFVWAKNIGGTSNNWASSIALDDSGNIYTTGYFYGTTDFDPGAGTFNLTASGSFPDGFNDIFISKLDLNGNFVWAKQMGGPIYEVAYSIAIDGLGNVYTTGYFRGISDFDPGTSIFNLTSPNTLEDIFISKLDDSGNFVWAKKISGINGESACSIGLDATGNVYILGVFQDTLDFDPDIGTANLISASDADIFILKLNNNGNFIWAKNMGGPSRIYGYSIAVDPSGNAYATGYFSGTADFDPGVGTFNLIANISYNIFISKLDASGNFVWAKSMGGGNNGGSSIDLDSSGNIYTTGFFNGTIDFDPDSGIFNLTSSGANNMFVHKMSQTIVGIKENFNLTNVAIYPNPSSGIFTISLQNKTVEANVCVYDLLGNCLLNKNCQNETNLKIDLSSQPKGIYFMEIVSDGNRSVNRIVLQ